MFSRKAAADVAKAGIDALITVASAKGGADGEAL